MDYAGRQTRLRSALKERRLGALLVTHLPNIRYLCGFTGSSAVMLVPAAGKPRFTTDGRYTQQARDEVTGATVRIAPKGGLGAAVGAAKGLRGRLGIEATRLTVAQLGELKKDLKRPLKPVSDVIERIRAIKEPTEVDSMRKAVNLASAVFDAVVPEVVPGVLESAIAAEIEYMSKRLGAEGMSFDTIVASGKRSALPHGRASATPIPAKGFVIFDFGVIVNGYCSDMTRTVHVGHAGRKEISVYNAVLQAQLAGISAVKPGVAASEVDKAARSALEKAGLGGYFTHSTGHGVGMEIHEQPSLRKASITKRTKKVNLETLQPGMVITIEPGVYIPGWGGVRIEDMVLVTETGCDVLTPTSKELVIL